MAHVFVSYSRHDQPFVRRLTEHLRAAGREAWVDWEGIAPSAKWMAEIRAAIDAADAFVFIISPDSLASRVCADEIEHARAANKRILPVVARAAANVPPTLAEVNWIVFASPDDAEALPRLIAALDTDPAWVSEHTRLTQRARQWDLARREPSFLLRGRDLSAAEAWLTDAANHLDPKPTDLQTQYILASRAGQTRSQRRQLVAAAGAVVIALALAVWAFIERDSATTNARLATDRAVEATAQRQLAEVSEKKAVENAALAEQRQHEAERQAALARARELSALAVSRLDADPEISLHLALASVNLAPTPQGEEALVRGLLESRLVAALNDDCHVQAAAFGHAGKHVAGRCGDGSVRVWSAEGTLRLRLPAARWKATSALLDHSESRVFVGADDGALRVYRLSDSRLVSQSGGPANDHSRLALSPDGSHLYAYGRGDGVQVYAAQTLQPLHRLTGDTGEVHWVRFPRDGKRVAALTKRGGPSGMPTVRFWDRDNGQALAAQGGHEIFLGGSLFSADGTRLLTKGDDEISEHWSPRLWDLVERRELGNMARAAGRWSVGTVDAGDNVFMSNGLQHTLELWRRPMSGTAFSLTSVLVGHTESVTDVAIHPTDNPERILTTAGDGTARLWRQTESANLLAVMRGHRGAVRAVSFSPDGARALTVGTDGTARVWRLDDVRFTNPWPMAEGTYAWAVADSDSSGRIVALVSPEGQVRIINVEQRRRLFDAWPLGGPPGRPGDRDRLHLALSPAGDRLVVRNTASGRAQILDTADGRRIAEFAVDRNGRDMRFSPDGRCVLIMSGVPTLVDVARGTTITRLRGSRAYIDRISISPECRSVFMYDSGREGVFHWHIDAGSRKQYTDAMRWPGAEKVRAFALSADGSRLVTAGETRVQVWTVATRRVDFERPWAASALDISPDGQWLGAGGTAGGLRVWNATTGEERLARLPWTSGAVDSLAYSPDGRLIVTNDAVLRADDGLVINNGQRGLYSRDGRRVFREAERPRGLVGPNVLEVVDCVPCQPLPALAALAKGRLARPALTLQEQQQFGLAPGRDIAASSASASAAYGVLSGR